MKPQQKTLLKIMALAVLIGLFFWVVDGVLAYFLHRDLLRLMIFEPPQTIWESIITAVPEYHLGMRLYVLVVCVAGGGVVSWGVIRRQRYHDQLEDSNRKLSHAQQMAHLGSWDWDISGGSLTWSDALYHIWGVRKGNFPLTEESIRALIHPDDRPMNEQMMLKISEGYDLLDWEFRIIRPDGQILHLYQNMEITHDDNGVPIHITGTMMDITERKISKLVLFESQQRYKSLFEDSPISLWEEDFSAVKAEVDALVERGVEDLTLYFQTHPDELRRIAFLKIFKDVNQATVSMYCGKDRYDVIREFSTLFTDASLQTLQNEILTFLNGDHVYEGEAIHRRVDGQDIIVSFRASIAPGYEDTWGKVYVSNFDVTQNRLAEEALRAREKDLRALYNSMTEMLVYHQIVTDENGRPVNYRILDCNPSFSAVTGVPREKALDGVATEVYQVDEAPFLDIYAAVADTGHPRQFEAFFEPLNKYFEISAFSPEKGHFATVALDITERKLAEQKIQQINQELETRVAERTRQLREANAELEAFAYSISHDLRAPLRAIDGFSRILQEEHVDVLDSQASHYIDLLRRNAISMSDLVNGLLDFSRKGRQSVNREVVNCADLVREVIEWLLADQGDRNIEWIVKPLPPCWADPQLLKQVWVNLIDNAVKFSREREKAIIEISAETKPAEILYTIKDNGAGFDMAYADRLFGVFQRLHRSEEFEGTGVGLAIVHRIIQRHGGSMWVDAKPEEGATIFFTLPKQGGVKIEE